MQIFYFSSIQCCWDLATCFDASLICEIFHDRSTGGMRCFQQLSPNQRAPLMRNKDRSSQHALTHCRNFDRFEFVEYRSNVSGAKYRAVITVFLVQHVVQVDKLLGPRSGEFSDEFRENIRNSRLRSIPFSTEGGRGRGERERENYETRGFWLKSSDSRRTRCINWTKWHGG